MVAFSLRPANARKAICSALATPIPVTTRPLSWVSASEQWAELRCVGFAQLAFIPPFTSR